MDITCAELQRVSLGFRRVASRLLSSDFEEAKSNLGRFLDYIDSTPVPGAFIDDCQAKCTSSWNMDAVLADATFHNPYQITRGDVGEVVFTDTLLRCIAVPEQTYEYLVQTGTTGKGVRTFSWTV